MPLMSTLPREIHQALGACWLNAQPIAADEAESAAGTTAANTRGGEPPASSQSGVEHYGDWLTEHRRLTIGFAAPQPSLQPDPSLIGPGLVDLGDRTWLEFRGDDRAAFLHNLCTNDVKALRPGQGCEAFITNVQGKTIGLVEIYCAIDRLVVSTVGEQAARLLPHFDKYHIREQVEFRDRSGELAMLLLAGHDVESLLIDLLGTLAPGRLILVEVRIAGIEVTLLRTGLLERHAYLLAAPLTNGPALWQALLAMGARPCGRRALDAARVEAGVPLFGIDLTDKNLPQEVDRNELAISFTKGCYLGQETVARIDALGHVNQTLRGIRLETPVAAGHTADSPLDASPLRAGDELFREGKSAGRVTSSVWSPRLQAPLALAYVRRGQEALESRFQTAAGEATVTALPLDA